MKTRHSLPQKITSKGIDFTLDVTIKNKKDIPKGKKYRTVYVLSKHLKGKTDLHGQKYKPSKWYFIN